MIDIRQAVMEDSADIARLFLISSDGGLFTLTKQTISPMIF